MSVNGTPGFPHRKQGIQNWLSWESIVMITPINPISKSDKDMFSHLCIFQESGYSSLPCQRMLSWTQHKFIGSQIKLPKFADNIFKLDSSIFILNFHHMVSIDWKSTLVQVVAWCWIGNKPACGQILTYVITHMHITPINELTHWDWDKIAVIFQTTFSNAFSWMKIYEFHLSFHWSLFLRFQLMIFQHWFRQWLGAEQATSHYLNQWWLVYWRIWASLGLNDLNTSCRFFSYLIIHYKGEECVENMFWAYLCDVSQGDQHKRYSQTLWQNLLAGSNVWIGFPCICNLGFPGIFIEDLLPS